MTPAEFISAIASAAQASMRQTGIPASFVIAQAALESAWAKSQLASRGLNLFGVKADSAWHGDVLTMQTKEFLNGQWVMVPARWRKYASWQACIDDHANFFKQNQRYKKCFAESTGEGWARAVQAAGYATDPAYAVKLISVIRAHDLTQFDKRVAA